MYNNIKEYEFQSIEHGFLQPSDCCQQGYGFLLDVAGGTITVTASDSEKYFITTVPTVEQSGDARFCIPAKTMMESLKELAEQPLNIGYNPDTQEVKVVHNSGSFVVMAMDAAPYPMAKTVSDDATRIEMPASVLLNGINRCLFATANDEIRLVMNGIYVDIKPDCIVFAGTDGRKLVRNTNHTVKSGLTAGFILQKKVSAILKAVLTKEDENISIAFDSEKATISSADMVMHFRLIEGRYPNYDAVIPKDNDKEAIIDKKAFVSALKRVLPMSNEAAELVSLKLEDNKLTINSEDIDFSKSASEIVPCEYNNEKITIGFKGSTLLQMLTNISGDKVTLLLSEASRAGIIKEKDENALGYDYISLIMPMLVS